MNGMFFSMLRFRGIRIYTLGVLFQSGLAILIPFQLGRLIDVIVYGGDIFGIFALLVAMAFAAIGLDYYLKKFIYRASRNQEVFLQKRLLEHFCRLAPTSIDGYRQGEIGMKFFRDVQSAGMLVRELFPQLLTTVFGTLLALGTVFYSNRTIGMIFLFALPVLGVSMLPYRNLFGRINRLFRHVHDRAMNRIFEFIHIFPFLKSMDAESGFKSMPDMSFRHCARVALRSDAGNFRFDLTWRLIVCGGEYAVLGTAGFLAWNKTIPVGNVVFYQILFLSVLNSFSAFFRLLPSWEGIRTGVESLHELLEVPNEEREEDNLPLKEFAGRVEVRDVTFRYPGSTRNVLDCFSCEIPSGSLIAVCGENGAGKTTLLKLLTGYMNPDAGEIYFDGHPVSGLQKKAIREQISVVFQNSLLITGSIRDNITLRNPQYDDGAIRRAAEMSGADRIISRFADGLEHEIGFDGGGLSGGERQKLAIARALIRSPRILVFDEVTNHLDYESRTRMRQLLLSLRGRVTVLLVSHDPDFIGLCDRKITLEGA